MKIVEIEDKPFHDLQYRSSGAGGIERQMVLPFYKARVDTLPDGIECLVAVSDVQGREWNRESNRLIGEAITEELTLLCEIDEIPKIDCVLLAGDLYDYPDCRKLGGTGDVTSVWNAFSNISPVVVGVLGNHDVIQASELNSNTVILDGSCQRVTNLCIGGVSGIIGDEKRNNRKSQVAYEQALAKAQTARTEVLVLHEGPDDPDNQQIGNDTIRAYLNKVGHSLVIFGHKHWDIPLTNIGDNQVMNVANRLVVLSK